jgi:hypothetical protein
MRQFVRAHAPGMLLNHVCTDTKFLVESEFYFEHLPNLIPAFEEKGHVARMPFTRAPRKKLTCRVDNLRPGGCPQMDRGRTRRKALLSNDLEFVKWLEIATDRNRNKRNTNLVPTRHLG